MRHAASALLVALASASQPPGGWPGYNNYPPPPQEQPPQQWGGYQQYGEQPQYGSEAVEPASEATADDADEAVEADVVAEPANETAVTEADADDEAPSTEPEVEVAEYAYDDGRGTSAYYGEVRAEYQAPSPSEPEQEPEAPTTGEEAVPPAGESSGDAPPPVGYNRWFHVVVRWNPVRSNQSPSGCCGRVTLHMLTSSMPLQFTARFSCQSEPPSHGPELAAAPSTAGSAASALFGTSESATMSAPSRSRYENAEYAFATSAAARRSGALPSAATSPARRRRASCGRSRRAEPREHTLVS